MIFETWKKSTLNSTTYQTFPESVRSLTNALVMTVVRENVCKKAKNVKSHVFGF